MKVVLVKPNKPARITEIDNNLPSLQKAVGGYIEAVYPFSDKVALVCNEDGKFNGSKPNRVLRTEDGKIYDIIYGTFFICGLGEEDFAGLTDELAQKYRRMYARTEEFVTDPKTGKITVYTI